MFHLAFCQMKLIRDRARPVSAWPWRRRTRLNESLLGGSTFFSPRQGRGVDHARYVSPRNAAEWRCGFTPPPVYQPPLFTPTHASLIRPLPATHPKNRPARLTAKRGGKFMRRSCHAVAIGVGGSRLTYDLYIVHLTCGGAYKAPPAQAGTSCLSSARVRNPEWTTGASCLHRQAGGWPCQSPDRLSSHPAPRAHPNP